MADQKLEQEHSGETDYEFSYFEEKFGVCCDHIKLAIATVGNFKDKIEQYLVMSMLANPGMQ